MTLIELSELARPYAETRAALSDRLAALEEELMAVRRRHLPEIRKALAKAQTQHNRLVTAVGENPALFDKPRTQVLHGIRLGFQKQKGVIAWADEESVVRLIKRHLPGLAETLIKTTEKPVKDAMLNLPAADLKKIGVEITDAGDRIVIRPMDGDLDKIVERLLESTASIE